MRSLLFTLLTGLAFAQLDIGQSCETDTQCVSFCCNNDGNYTITGNCTHIEDNARCEQRKQNDTIALIVILIVIWVVAGICFYAKVQQERKKKADIETLRILGVAQAANEAKDPEVVVHQNVKVQASE